MTATAMDTTVITNAETEIKSEIQSFYNDMTILLTGATGFLGNLIMEKLMR